MNNQIKCPSCDNQDFQINQLEDTRQLLLTCLKCTTRLITIQSVDLGVNKFVEVEKDE